MSLTDRQRRWLGTAIVMAKADGVLKLQEMQLIQTACNALGLSKEGRAEVEKMMHDPPTPVELASWALSDQAGDRVGLYRLALKMAEADGEIAEPENALLECLATVLKLTPEERSQARE